MSDGSMIGADRLRAVCEAMYGPRWQTDVSRDLGVSDRTVRRWLAGSRRIDEALWRRLLGIARMRSAQLARVIAELSGDDDDEPGNAAA